MMTRRSNVAMRQSNDNYAQLTHFEVISSFSEQLFQQFSQFYGLRSYLVSHLLVMQWLWNFYTEISLTWAVMILLKKWSYDIIFNLAVSRKTTFGPLNMDYLCGVIYCDHLSKRYISVSFNLKDHWNQRYWGRRCTRCSVDSTCNKINASSKS